MLNLVQAFIKSKGWDLTELYKMQMSASPFRCTLFLSHMPALPSRHVALLFHVTRSVTFSRGSLSLP